MEEKANREIFIEREYYLKIGDYKDQSGLLKEELYSWSLCSDNKTYIIS